MTHGQTDRHIAEDIRADKQTNRLDNSCTNRPTERVDESGTERHIAEKIWMDRQTDIQAERNTGQMRDSQAGRQTEIDRQAETNRQAEAYVTLCDVIKELCVHTCYTV